MKNIEALQQLLGSQQKIVITAHANPDGDAIGSSLGMYFYLKALSQTSVSIIMPTAMPDNLSWMNGFDNIMIYDNQSSICNKYLEEATIIFSLDYNGLNRIETMQHALKKSAAFKVMIDHHMHPEDFCDAVLSDTTASSTCQLVYEFIQMMEHNELLNLDILNALYVGILTDTGGFRHATSARLFKIVGEFLEHGVNNNQLSDWVFNDHSIKSFKLFAHCISNRLEIWEQVNTGVIVIDQEDHQNFNIQRGDLEGIVNFALKIRKLKCAVMITERKDIVKLSMRSKDDFSVQEICSKHFNGGGHKNASGGSMKISLGEVVEKLKKILHEEYLEQLSGQ